MGQLVFYKNLNDTRLTIARISRAFTGFIRGSFQGKTQVMLPNQEIFTSKKPDYYKPADFYIGARVNLNEFIFEITSADVYALRYMEIHCDKVL